MCNAFDAVSLARSSSSSSVIDLFFEFVLMPDQGDCFFFGDPTQFPLGFKCCRRFTDVFSSPATFCPKRFCFGKTGAAELPDFLPE